jgi:malate dehydrogenase
MPPMVAIVGAGEIGAAAARTLALRSRVAVIRLIDVRGQAAAGKALDLLQSGPVRGFDTRIEAVADLEGASGAGAIIIADPIDPDDRSSEDGFSVLRRLHALGCFEDSTVICAGAGHRALMQRGFDELGLPRRRAIGSAPEALASTARALVALEARAATHQVALTVVGALPERMVVPWGDASIAGHSVVSVLTPPQLNRLEQRLRGLWPPGPNALGTAAAMCAEAATTGSRRMFTAFVSLDRDNGTKAPVCAWPVFIGTTGLERVAALQLSERDQVIMDGVLE